MAERRQQGQVPAVHQGPVLGPPRQLPRAAVEEEVLLARVAVVVAEHPHRVGAPHPRQVLQQGLGAVDGRVQRRARVLPAPVEVFCCQSAASAGKEAGQSANKL